MSSETMKFLENLFEYKPDNDYLLIWTIPDKRSYWFQDIEVAEQILSQSQFKEELDVYIGVGLVPEFVVRQFGNKKQYRRCKAKNIKGISGLWADIDVAGEGHKKENLPPTKEKARELITKMPLQPTFIIDSGHGLQCWWLFKEPWIFEDADERAEAASLAKRWIYTIQYKASKSNWDVDATTDLSRVMRIPGTTNNKADPVPVKIIEENDNKFNPAEFEPFLIDEEEASINVSVADPNPEIGELNLNPKANPPFDKWEALQSIEPNIRKSWEHKRDDLQDQSASAYDMSLATYAAMAEWEDDEIAHLLIAHRRKNSEDLKLRQDYYQRTIAKARQSASKSQAEESIEVITEEAEKVNQQGTQKQKRKIREALLKTISSMMEVEIERFIKYVCDPPQYRLETNKGNIMIGGAGNVLRQSTFRSKIFAATNQVIPKFKGDKWDNIVQALGNACVEESLGEEATDEGTAKAWLNTYLNEKTILEEEEEAAKLQVPLRKEGEIYIFGNDFRKWLRINQMERLNAKEMGSILRAYNCEPTKINITIKGSPTTRGVWKLPQEIHESN